MLDGFVTWVTANPAVAAAFAGIAAAAFTGIAWITGLFKRSPPPPPPPTIINNPTVPVPAPQLLRPGEMVLTLDQYEEKLNRRWAELAAQIVNATVEERALLTAQKSELEGKLRNLDTSFKDAQTRIRDLEQLLEREGNQLGHERLERAEKALAAGDFDEADKLLAQISDEEDLAVQRKARAEFGRGQIAEEQVRWHDAARHYGEAARLNPTFDTLERAGTFYWRAGDYERKARVEEDLLALSKKEFGLDSEKTSQAMNNLALAYSKLGRHEEAEPLYRQAI